MPSLRHFFTRFRLPLACFALALLLFSAYQLWAMKKDSDIELSSNFILNDSILNIENTNLFTITEIANNLINSSNQSQIHSIMNDISLTEMENLLAIMLGHYKKESQVTENKIFIQPVNPVFTTNGSKTFTAYEETSTDPVPIKGDWISTHDGLQTVCEISSVCELHMNTVGNFEMRFTKYSKEELKENASTPYQVVLSTFSDEIPTWASNAIETMKAFGLMKGYENNAFGSEDPLTRAQIAMVIFRAMEIYTPFTYEQFYGETECETDLDVPKDHWSYQAMCFGDRMQWFKNIDMKNNKAKINQAVTRAELTSILHQSILLFADNNAKEASAYRDTFADVSESHPYLASIMSTAYHGVVKGSEKNGKIYFYPDNQVNRAEFATMMYRALSLLNTFKISKKSYDKVDDDSKKI